jgi:hypothetical protein
MNYSIYSKYSGSFLIKPKQKKNLNKNKTYQTITKKPLALYKMAL